MKLKGIIVASILTLSYGAIAQQPNNGGYENWQNVGSSTEEPTNWSGMMTGNLCGFCGLGSSQRVFRETNAANVHSGAYSARIESTSYLGNIVNGNITTGEVNAPSTTPADGYNKTVRTNGNFNHPFSYKPDSVVVWAKYNITDASDQARISITLHDDYDVRDPSNAASAPYVVARAVQNFQTGGTGSWTRISVPFDYASYPATNVAYMLASVTSSFTAGAGNAGAVLWVDDLEFIYNPPAADFTSTATTICAGESIDFTDISTSGSPLSWAWDFGDGGTSTSQNPSYVFNTPGVWNVELTSTNLGGSDIQTMSITVNPSPNVVASGTATICEGQSTVISATGASSYSWDQSLGAGASHTVAPTTTTVYTVTGTDAGCSASEIVTVTVNPVPTVTGIGSTTICSGTSTTISASGATTYSWDNGLGAGVSQTVSPTTSTNYTVTGTTAGCSNTALVSITVLPSPNVVANGTASICVGSSVTISGSGASSYSWDNGLGAGTSHNVTPTTTTTYTVTGTTSGCSAQDQVTITVDAQLAPGTASPLSACISDNNIDLLLGLSGEDPGGIWSDDDATGGLSGNIFDASVTTPGTYNFTYTFPAVGACPLAQTTTQVTVTNTVSAGTPTASNEACDDASSVDLYGSITGYTTGGVWGDDDGTGALTGSSFDPVGVTPGTYNFTYTINGGTCGTDAETIAFTVNPLPNVVASNDDAICIGASTAISATGATTYNWDNGLGAGAGQTVSPAITTTYTVNGIDGNGCENSDQVTITVNSLPAVDAGLNQSICIGEEATLSGAGAETYAWDNSVIDGVPFTQALGTMTYTVTGTDVNGCENTDQVDVTVNDLPTVSVSTFAEDTVCTTDGTLPLPAGTPSGGTYSGWGVSGSNFDPSIVVPGTHDVYYTYVDNNGCSANDVTSIEVILCLGIYEGETIEYALYPNPTSENLTLEFDQLIDVELTIIDAFGKTVYRQSIEDASTTIEVRDWTPGSYFVKLTDANGIFVDAQKITIAR